MTRETDDFTIETLGKIPMEYPDYDGESVTREIEATAHTGYGGEQA